MKPAQMNIRLVTLGIALSSLITFSSSAANSTFQLQTRCTFNGTGAAQGWAATMYSHSADKTNQSLQISCRGLDSNRVYHVMASWGTNGQLIHLSDFVCNRSGAILLHHIGGTTHHFSGTNNPYPAWNIVCNWSNHMSGVIFPGLSTNWCDVMHYVYSLMVTKSMMGGGMGGMGGWDNHGNWDNFGGTNYYGGMGDMCDGWPASTNWSSGMTNWWPTMQGWCWDYTNTWNSGSVSNDWWCSWHRSASHTMPFPPSIDPVPVINGLIVSDDHLQPILTADLATPDSFTYSVRCDFTNHGVLPGAKCTLQASATKRATHFALSASGLLPSSPYFLDIDSANVSPINTDRQGRVQIRKLPAGVTGIRGIGTISITDQHHSVILSAALRPE